MKRLTERDQFVLIDCAVVLVALTFAATGRACHAFAIVSLHLLMPRMPR